MTIRVNRIKGHRECMEEIEREIPRERERVGGERKKYVKIESSLITTMNNNNTPSVIGHILNG